MRARVLVLGAAQSLAHGLLVGLESPAVVRNAFHLLVQVRIAQQSSDDACLAHALASLCQVGLRRGSGAWMPRIKARLGVKAACWGTLLLPQWHT